MKNISNNKDIISLINIISYEIEKGKVKFKSALEKEKTISYWNIGMHIHKHLKKHSDKPDYGARLFSEIADNLNIGERSLYFSHQFYKSYQDINIISDYLTWTHFKILLSIKSEDKRKEFEKILLEKKLSTRDFYNLVKRNKKNFIASKSNQLTLNQGIPYLYALKNKNNKLYLDLGFRFYSDYYSSKLIDFDSDSLIQTSKNKKDYSFQKADFDNSALYTYKAFIVKVIDGDTIKTDIDLGFNTITNQTLRLRGINAFEISTKEGKKAKEFVQERLKNLDFIVIKTYRPDKYSRYLVDLFYSNEYDDLSAIINNGNFLNQELLDNNLAVKYYIY
jgi:endonuclease YncB( thermonuclease family)